MKIVNRETFLKLPSGTLFMKMDSIGVCVVGLCIKYETWGSTDECNDFIYIDIQDAFECDGDADLDNIFHRATLTGESFNMDFESSKRDGQFEEDQMFMVWERKDVLEFIDKLKECMKTSHMNV